jgi:hypothetical protein
MKAAEDRLSGEPAELLDRPMARRILIQRQKSSEPSVSWWAIHSAVGLLVTLSDISRRRWCLRMTKTNTNLEADCWHDQEVHGGDARRMVVEKGLPGLRPPSPAPRQVLGQVDDFTSSSASAAQSRTGLSRSSFSSRRALHPKQSPRLCGKAQD